MHEKFLLENQMIVQIGLGNFCFSFFFTQNLTCSLGFLSSSLCSSENLWFQ